MLIELNSCGSIEWCSFDSEYVSLDGVDPLMDTSHPRRSTGPHISMTATTTHFRYDVGKINDGTHHSHHYKIEDNANTNLKHGNFVAVMLSIINWPSLVNNARVPSEVSVNSAW